MLGIGLNDKPQLLPHISIIILGTYSSYVITIKRRIYASGVHSSSSFEKLLPGPGIAHLMERPLWCGAFFLTAGYCRIYRRFGQFPNGPAGKHWHQ